MSDPVDTRLGAKVRELRMLRGLTQMDLGKRIGLTFQQVQKYERGTNRISVATLLRICDVFEISPGTILDGIGEDRGIQPTLAPASHEGLHGMRALAEIRSKEARGAIARLARAIVDADM